MPQGRKLSKKDAVPFKYRGLMSVNTPNGPLYVDKTAFDVRPRRPARRQPANEASQRSRAPQLAQGCGALKIPASLEQKTYPRDIMCRGRVRVQLHKDDGSGTMVPVRKDITNRKELYLKLAEAVKENLKKAPQPQQQQPAGGGGQQGGGGGGGGSKKKSAKKKKKKR